MNRANEHDDDALFSLICSLDEKLQRIDIQSESLATITDLHDELTSAQKIELRRAEEALHLLAKVRRNLDELKSLEEDDDQVP